MALTRAGDTERACAALAQCGEDEPSQLAEGIQLLFEEGHTSGALRLLALLRERWGFGHKDNLLAAATRTLVAEGRHEEALDLLVCPTITFGAVPSQLAVIESWAAQGEPAKKQALERLEALLAVEEDSFKAEYLLTLSKLAPERCPTHLAAQVEEIGMRAGWYGRTVAATAARLGQAESVLAVEGTLRSPLTRVAIRAGLIRGGDNSEQHVEAALALIDDNDAMETSLASVQDNRRVALLDLAAALHTVDEEQAGQLFDRVQSTVIDDHRGDDKRIHLSSLLRSRAEAGDTDGALSTLMALSPAQRCHSYTPLLRAYAGKGDLAGVLTVVKKLGGSDRERERAEAVLGGLHEAARIASGGADDPPMWLHRSRGVDAWPPG